MFTRRTRQPGIADPDKELLVEIIGLLRLSCKTTDKIEPGSSSGTLSLRMPPSSFTIRIATEDLLCLALRLFAVTTAGSAVSMPNAATSPGCDAV